MPSGGYRKPRGAQPASGPGKFSKRTDAQAVQTPGLKDPSVQYGDVQKLEAAQRIAPLPRGVDRPPPNKSRQMQGAPMQRGELPSYLFDTPSALPGTPDTSGLTTGAGPGPESLEMSAPIDDVREFVMQRIADFFGNEDAVKWLIDFRNEKAGALGAGVQGGGPTLSPFGPTPGSVPVPPESGEGAPVA